MADHYRKSQELLEEVESLRTALRHEYRGHRRPPIISQLHQDIGAAMKLANVHAELSVRQQLQELVAAMNPGSVLR